MNLKKNKSDVRQTLGKEEQYVTITELLHYSFTLLIQTRIMH